jgi:YHS domain-containing protein
MARRRVVHFKQKLKGGCVVLILAAAVAVAYGNDRPGHEHAGASHDAQQADSGMQTPACPVTGKPANLAVSIPTPDGPVYFFCPLCVPKYQENPEQYAAQVAAQRVALADRPKVQVTCPITRNAVDPDVSIERDGQKVYFCCPDCIGKYEAAPGKYASALANSYTYQIRCPVMGEEIDPTSYTLLADGRKIFYCCDGCGPKLFGDSAKYGKNLAEQGYQYDFANLKKVDSASTTHDEGHEGHGGHGGHSGHSGRGGHSQAGHGDHGLQAGEASYAEHGGHEGHDGHGHCCGHAVQGARSAHAEHSQPTVPSARRHGCGH